MSEQSESPPTERERTELPIERGFPIERVNEIAEKEGRAGMYYRPIYTMHKWWARRLGCVFRAISLYTLIDDPSNVEVFEPGQNNERLSDFGGQNTDISKLLEDVDLGNPDGLWELYPKDVRIKNKRVLDPFAGGGTSLVEASRFGADVVGNDLNPVAWFVTKKQLEAGETDISDLESAFKRVKDDVSEEILNYYKTPCPNGDHEAEVMHNFWVKELDCTSCNSTVPLYRDYRVAKGRYENDDKYNVLCPDCESVVYVNDWQSESTCGECHHKFNPSEGNVDYGDYICPHCGQKYPITDAISEQNGFDLRLYAVEYYCGHCENQGAGKSTVKGYKRSLPEDISLFEDAKAEWEAADELHSYVPDKPIRPGWSTMAYEFEGSMSGNGNLPRHGYNNWSDMFNERQLLSISKILNSIDGIQNQNLKEYLLLAVSDSLRYNSMMVGYHQSRNHIDNLMRTNRLNPPLYPAENNVWGGKYGSGTFTAMFDQIRTAIEYASAPTDRYITNSGDTIESEPFGKPIGEGAKITQGDVRELNYENEFDAVITDPPYYNNVLYSELSDYFYVWQKSILESQYECFEPEHTPRKESIVVNPASKKGDKEFETELKQAFQTVHKALKQDGILTFTYHHSSSESWGELLEALCDVGFTIKATYPITADINKFLEGENVSFDIVIVARPHDDRSPVSWNSLRRDIYRTARRTRTQLEEERDLSRGDIGVVEMGACFREYSKHHGKVQRNGEIMSAKEVVQEIYGIIQEASDIGVEDVFIDLLDSNDPSFDDVNKLCRGTNATPDELKEMCLYNQDDGFELGTWDNEKRQAYIQERTNGDGGDHLSNLDKLQFLRYRYEKGQAVQNYVDKWGVDDDLRELAGRLADVTGDDTYTRVLGDRDITSY